MSAAITQVGVELNEEIDKLCENRRVKGCIAQRRSANKNYRCMRKICGVDDERTKEQRIYIGERKKEQVRELEGLYMYIMKR